MRPCVKAMGAPALVKLGPARVAVPRTSDGRVLERRPPYAGAGRTQVAKVSGRHPSLVLWTAHERPRAPAVDALWGPFSTGGGRRYVV